MKKLRNAGIWAAGAILMLTLDSASWSQQTGTGNSYGGIGGQNGTSTGQGTGTTTGQGADTAASRNRTSLPPVPGDDPTISPLTEEEQAKLRNADRQKKLQDDTAKLLSLANELKADVDKSTKDTLSLDVVRKADEIEKLAHNVKERMKGT
jgi:hypothetical protein